MTLSEVLPRKNDEEEGRMKAIFLQNCESWDERNCLSEDLRSLYEKKMSKGKKFELPDDDELEKLNEICKKCNHPLKIEEMKCPGCGNKDLQPPKIIISGKVAGYREIYNYRCEPCDRVLYSHIKFF